MEQNSNVKEIQESGAVWRKTKQFLLPDVKPESQPGMYAIYPVHPMGEGKIYRGFESLATEIAKHKVVIIDGYQGVFFREIVDQLNTYFSHWDHQVQWINMDDYLLSPAEIERITAPFLGGDDPLFGTRTTLELIDFFDSEKLSGFKPDPAFDLNIIYGTGATLSGIPGFLIYVDLPKNEMQYRARAQSITNIGAARATSPMAMYKRFYFVDWVVLNQYKRQLLDKVDIFADGQHKWDITWTSGKALCHSLHHLSRNIFRVRPWFEPGTWGGQWCMEHIEGLNPDVPNYAWSFELIVPENGLIFESSGNLLEASFDCLMFQEAEAVLGEAYPEYGVEFPIRFDFLDTFDGGNLSVQCHPLKEYTKKHFNEDFTQEECYYILDAKEDAIVYLGFRENIDPDEFRNALTGSFEQGKPVEIENFVNTLPAKKHDLFLIPPGTIHASGKNNLVLEISSTPYIFTFKMYDWIRPDLDGKPRPLNISRGMENLQFDRKGRYVSENLISKPKVIESGPDWKIEHLKTHEKHLYDVHRITVVNEVSINTHNKCHVLNLVEGLLISVETRHGGIMQINYAETFVIPAAAESYRIINKSSKPAKLVLAFVK